MRKILIAIVALGALGMLLIEVGFLIFAYKGGLVSFLMSLGSVSLANAALLFGVNGIYTNFKDTEND